MKEAISEMYSSLREQFKGDLLLPQHAEYESTRAVWNGMVAKRAWVDRLLCRRQ